MIEPANILLVDDQPAKLLSYEVILGGLGETLLRAESAREALAQLLKHDVAVVLIDVQMPDIDGFELATMIREHPRFQQTPLIFVSAIHLSDIDRIKGYEAGAVDYVPVPVIPEVLKAKVKVFADLHRKTRELERLNVDLERRVEDRTAALERLNEQLEVRIEERTNERERALAQLFEAQKLDTIGQLTGGVAHDFNNLLMAMMGSMEVLKKRISEDDQTAHRLLDNALKGAERGAALTQRLLSFARRQELRPQTIAVADLIDGMKDLFDRALGPGIRLERDLPNDLPHVLIDPNQLELALLNLAVNARDAMPEGGALHLRANRCPAGAADTPKALIKRDYVRLSIIDTGTGMDETVAARAAEPFFTTKGVGKGTGLGLSMVQGLAAQSGGALHISSKRGEGTRVDLWIPEAEVTLIPEARPVRMTASVSSEPINVLVVDDDSLVAAGTVAMLEDLGHLAIEANSAHEALDILARGQFVDLVITDHAMPGMTGVELAKRLKETRPDLRVILATGYAELPSDPLGANTLPRLSKPFLQIDLARAIAGYANESGHRFDDTPASRPA